LSSKREIGLCHCDGSLSSWLCSVSITIIVAALRTGDTTLEGPAEGGAYA
jgi:hypothetical protein